MSQYYDAFISYGRVDSKAFATKLDRDLTEADFKIPLSTCAKLIRHTEQTRCLFYGAMESSVM